MLLVDADGRAGRNSAAEEGVGQGVLETVLDHAAERSGSVDRIEALVGQQ